MSVNINEQSANETKQTSVEKSEELNSNLLKRIQNYAFGTKHAVADESIKTNEDLIYQLRANIARLEDESSRLDFMMDEVSSLIKRANR